MLDWASSNEIAKDDVAFGKFMHALLGLYIWEWLTSLDFEWQYLSGARKFKWPAIFYFLNRYCLLFSLIGIAIALNVTEQINCQGLYTFNQCFGNASIGLASINLSLRTMAVWSRRWGIVIPLIAIIFGHWTLLLHGILVQAQWFDGQGCVITQTDSNLLAITFIYTMAFDFVVLCLTAFGLWSPGSMWPRSRLVNLVLDDGLIYFLIAFFANLTATIFMKLNLNPVMSIIGNVPAAIISSIVACRAVRRLTHYLSGEPEMFDATIQDSALAFRSAEESAIRNQANLGLKSGTGYDVQMDTVNSTTTKHDGKALAVDNHQQSFVDLEGA